MATDGPPGSFDPLDGTASKDRKLRRSPSQTNLSDSIRHLRNLDFSAAAESLFKDLSAIKITRNAYLKIILFFILLFTIFSMNLPWKDSRTVQRKRDSEMDYVNSLIKRDSKKLAAARNWAKPSPDSGKVQAKGSVSINMGPPRFENRWPHGFDWIRSLLGIELKKLRTLIIYCAPKPYDDAPNNPQRRALLSWLRLSPQPKVVLLGNDASFYELAEEFQNQVFVESNIDRNFEGIPLFSSILWRAQAMDSDMSLLINSETVLLNDFMTALDRVKAIGHWLIVARGWKFENTFPFSFEEAPKFDEDPNGALGFDSSIREFTTQNGALSNCSNILFWAWNRTPLPLHYDTTPPFLVGSGIHDDWLTHEAAGSKIRRVIDVSYVATVLDFTETLPNDQVLKEPTLRNSDSQRSNVSWKVHLNKYLARKHSAAYLWNKTSVNIPYHIAHCKNHAENNLCIMDNPITESHACVCTGVPISKVIERSPNASRPYCKVLLKSPSKKTVIHTIAKPNSPEGMPHTIEHLLAKMAKRVDNLKVVTLVAVSSSYVDMLFSFACRLRMLGLDGNLVVAALDKVAYRQAYTRGLAVYLENTPPPNASNPDTKDCGFHSPCFWKLTKMKSRAVLRVLKLGYSVLWSDVDIVWFKDPLPHLLSFGPSTMPIQSDEPVANKSGAGMRRMNSGFYLARAENSVIKAFSIIVRHALTSNHSEQPSFYYVFCGYHKERLVEGKDECVRDGLRVIFLDRERYPNGAVNGIWNTWNVTKACQRWDCTILHNNWVSGKPAKMKRFLTRGFWFFDEERETCKYSWYSKIRVKIVYSNSTTNSNSNANG